MLAGVLSLLFVPPPIGIVYGLFASLENIWFQILLPFFAGGLTSSPIWINLLSLKKSLKEQKLLQNGDFDIVVCEVQYKDEKLVHWHTEKFLHFNGFKEVSVGNVNYDLVSQGDEFYIVHYKGRTEIKFIYSLKMYVLKEK